MIRVNLLNNRRESNGGFEGVVAAGGPSAFINRYEIRLGVLFLALGAGILSFNSQSNRSAEPDAPRRAPGSDGIAAAPRPQRLAAAERSYSRAAQPSEPAPDVSPATPDPRAAAGTVPAPNAPEDRPGESPGETAAASEFAKVAARPPPEPAAFAEPAEPAVSSSRAGPASSPSERASGELSALDVSARGDSLQILATIGGQPRYQMFRLNSPKRVVVDLSGATLSLPASQRQFTASHPLVERIRLAQFQLTPLTVRMVLDVSEFPEMSVERTPGGLIFQLAPPAP